jgi:hypothetical protein
MCVTQEINLPNYPKRIDRKELYELRANSGLSRQVFYLQLIEGASYSEKIELGIV